MHKVAQKNRLMGMNGQMSRHMETTAKEYQAMGCFRQIEEAIPEMRVEMGQTPEGCGAEGARV